MNRTISTCVLISAAAVVLIVSIVRPTVLSDQNAFLKSFILDEFLTIVGVMLTITLASAAQIHLTLNEIEEKRNKVFLVKTRQNVRSSAYSLITLFLASVALAVFKSDVGDHEWAQSLVNGAALFLLLWQTLIMVDLTQLIFAIKPQIDD